MKLRAVLFDLDGVLVDSYDIWKHVLHEAVEHFQGLPFTDADFRAVWGQAPDADVNRFLPGVSRPDLERFYGERFSGRLGGVPALPGAREALADVRGRGLGRAVVTNAPRRVAEDLLAVTELRALVELVIGADEVARPKPAPEMIERALAGLAAAPAEAILVGDSRYDVMAGKAAGVYVVGVGVAADETVASLAELPAIVSRLQS